MFKSEDQFYNVFKNKKRNMWQPGRFCHQMKIAIVVTNIVLHQLKGKMLTLISSISLDSEFKSHRDQVYHSSIEGW